MQLLQDTLAVAGTVQLVAGQQTAEQFQPGGLLTPSATYTLLITQAVRDVDGDALASAVAVRFSTGTSAATASCSTHCWSVAYDPATGVWTIEPPLSAARYGLVAGAVKGVPYAVGGYIASGPTSVVESYRP